jgi:hypothetical protein
MEFVLQQQAQYWAQFNAHQAEFRAHSEEFRARNAEIQARQEKFEEGLAAHDKRLAKAERLLVRGAKILAKQRESQQNFDRKMEALIDAQIRGEESTRELRAIVQALIDSQRKSGNGHS